MNINEILFIIILFIFYLCLIKYKKKNNKEILSYNDNVVLSPSSSSSNNNIIFDYNNLPYKDHHELGFNNGIIYNNSWIENIDPITNKPVYKSRYDIEKFYDIKSRFTYDTKNDYEMTGVDDPNVEKMNDSIVPTNNGKTLKEIYDNSFINYKSKIPVKNVINNTDESTIDGASNLSMLSPDTWIYENENPLNGGIIRDGLYAYDNDLLKNAKF